MTRLAPQRLAAERLDVLEAPPPRKGCNVRLASGKRCGRLVVARLPGYVAIFRVCVTHERVAREHNAIVARILSLPARPRDA